MSWLRRLGMRTIAIAATVCIASTVAVAGATSLITSGDIKNHTIQMKDLNKKVRKLLTKGGGSQGAPGAQGPPGSQGPAGPQGAQGDSNETTVSSLGGAFAATNGTCSITPDGVACGPYSDGGAAGGSLRYDGLNGQALSDVKSLSFFARYISEGDTGGVGVPYLRIFLNGDNDDAIFSPNTQPPDPDVGEGPFHTWVATSGVWRYDDDGGVGGTGTYGVNGAPFSTLITDHGNETISGIYISTGFTTGSQLQSLIRTLEVNGQEFEFRG
ncbi:MAG TPA: collagen-like protein [Solirubrobacterales bacterium]|jgi:hypothetical protein